MQILKFSTILLLLISFSYCSMDKSTKVDKPKEKKSQKITIKTDLFEIIAPEIKHNKTYNLFVAIDPHADGKLASKKTKLISEKHKSIIIGLNNVENNIPNFIDKIDNAINYLKNSNVKINNIYLVGFSGGARMALQYAKKKNISGIVMCGAGPGNIMQQNFNFNLVEIVGTRDFNFIEQYYSPYSDLVQKKDFLSLSFKGKHEWPSQELLLKAASFLLKNSNVDIGSLDNIVVQDSLNLYFEKMDFLSFKALESNYKINPSEENRQILISFLDNNTFKKYIANFENTLQTEMNRNKILIQNLDTKNFNWWKTEIDNIVKLSNENSNKILADSYARTKAFIGILMYSKVSAEIKNGNSKKLEKYLDIYEYAEPDNPDVQKFKDVYIKK